METKMMSNRILRRFRMMDQRLVQILRRQRIQVDWNSTRIPETTTRSDSLVISAAPRAMLCKTAVSSKRGKLVRQVMIVEASW